ncbi:hypothetical protein G7Y89_g15663 [Cudoniella acicularis]|uniref:Cytochrome P450 n=1 Tax=Cudoniella acicularis TaxID=354080 RepID=A0A8H4QIH0_9HELO|nr:hypothetical protein G7Y89_g15663 [Cudoniella acicularis]
MLNLLLARRDTTAGLLSNAFHTLVRHLKVWQKLSEEVEILEGRTPTYEDLKNMKYLKYVLNEMLHLYPPIPNNARFASASTVLPTRGGPPGESLIHITPGTIILYLTYSLHRRTDIYGPNASEFIPERWAPDTPSGPLRPGWGYIPFNSRPRIRVG